MERAHWLCSACGRPWPKTVPVCPGDGTLAVVEQFGDWRLEARIGSNATGELFRARAIDDHGEPVALKLLFPGIDLQASFVAEPLTHDNLLTLRAVGRRPDGTTWLVTDLHRGVTLRQLLSDAPFTPAIAAELGRQLATALAFLHGRRLVHGDLRAGTTLVSLRPDGTYLRVSDFGLIAKGGEQAVGAPSYRAPELLGGGKATTASDVYALGCLLFEMVSGDKLFADASARRDGPLPVLPSLPGAPAGAQHPLADVIAACVASKAEGRPTAAWLVERLGELAEVMAPPRLRRDTLIGIPVSSVLPPAEAVVVEGRAALPGEQEIAARLAVVLGEVEGTQVASSLRQVATGARELDRLISEAQRIDLGRVRALLRSLAIAGQQLDLWHGGGTGMGGTGR